MNMSEIGVIGELVTTPNEQGIDVEWRIPDFLNFPDRTNHWYISHFFYFNGSRWWLRLYPNGSKENDSIGQLNLVVCKSIEPDMTVDVSVSLTTGNKDKYFEKCATLDFDYTYCSHKFNRIVSRSELQNRQSELLPRDVLIVRCSMRKTVKDKRTERKNSEKEELKDDESMDLQVFCSSQSRGVESGIKRMRTESTDLDHDISQESQEYCYKQTATARTGCEAGVQCTLLSDVPSATLSGTQAASPPGAQKASPPKSRKRRRNREKIIHPNSPSTGNNTQVECSYCNGTFDFGILASHKIICRKECIKCLLCFIDVPLKNWMDGHVCQREAREGETSAELCSITPQDKLHQDLKKLLMNKEDCDVVFIVQGQEIHAHKNILRVRSPVFAAMKDTEMDIIIIEHCNFASFTSFLSFIYCGDVEMISEDNVAELFTLASNYEVWDLRAKCLRFMKYNMTVETFCEITTLAFQNCESDLIRIATDYFMQNGIKISDTAQWNTFVDKNPTVSRELLNKYIKRPKY